MQGQIFIQGIDINTNEVINEQLQKNIITNNFVRTLIDSSHIRDFTINISNAKYKPSPYPALSLPDNGTLGFTRQQPAIQIPGVPNIQYVAGTETTLPYVQLAGRFSPPSTGQTRTIKSVLLSTAPSQWSKIVAFSELATPCVQTSSQVYDIYYRILFDYTEINGSLSKESYLAIIEAKVNSTITLDTLNTERGINNQFPILKQKPGDNFVELSSYMWNYNVYYQNLFKDHFTASTSKDGIYKIYQQLPTTGLDFNKGQGDIYCSVRSVPGWGSIKPVASLIKTNIFESASKIQNLFGFKTDTLSNVSIPYLDIDNLPTGSGTVTTGGAWDNRKAETTAGMYRKTLMPKKEILYITKSGAVGVSEYKYSERTFIGSQKGNTVTGNDNLNPVIEIPGLMAYSGTSLVGASHKSLLGDITSTYFGAEQISATISYDGTSVLIPKKDKVLLYSIAGSEYWFITGTFTNIHQLAVVNGIVYIACRDTGLYRCDPRQTLTATLVNITGSITPDFSKCNGVSTGYNNTLWAVGKDAIASFNGTTWSVYNSTTTPAFGSNNDHYDRIGYIKVDKSSADAQMMLVYKADYNSTKLGLFWSLTTSLVETPTQPALSNAGRPKFTKTDVDGLDGYWLVISNDSRIYRCAFNASAFTTEKQYTPGNDSSVLFVKKDNTNYFHCGRYSSGYIGGYSASAYGIKSSFTTLAGVTEYENNTSTLESVLLYLQSASYHDYRTIISSPTSSSGYSGYYDNKAVIMLDDGIVFSINKFTCSGPYGVLGLEVNAFIYQIGLENNLHGGAFRDITRKNYGWNGTAWELNHTGSKITHSSPQLLKDGVTVSFTDGSTGVSFQNGNMYTFGVCEGLLKDNATKASLKLPMLFSKTETGICTLSSSVVPALTDNATGSIQISPSFLSKDAFHDPANANRITFPGNTAGEFAVGENQLSGDFEIAIPCTHLNDPLVNRLTSVGLGDIHRAGVGFIALGFYETTARLETYGNPYDYSDANVLFDVSGLVLTDVIKIKRIGTAVQLLKNSTVVYTLVDNINTNPVIKKKRLDIIFGKNGNHSNWYQPSNTFCPLVTITTNSQDNCVKLGDAVLGTEYYDINCKGFVLEAPIKGKLNGVTATVRTDLNDPAPGEISIDSTGLYAWFNTADAGKTIEIQGTRYWNK